MLSTQPSRASNVHEARVTSTLPYIRDVPHSSLFRMRKGSYSRTSTLRALVAATCHLRARMRTRRPRVDVDLRVARARHIAPAAGLSYARFVKLCKVPRMRGKLPRVPRSSARRGVHARARGRGNANAASPGLDALLFVPNGRSRRVCAGGEYYVVRNNRETFRPLYGVKLLRLGDAREMEIA